MIKASKAIPFIVIGIAVAFMAVDTFTPYQITDEVVSVITYTLTPIGLGGLINKGWDTYKAIKTAQK